MKPEKKPAKKRTPIAEIRTEMQRRGIPDPRTPKELRKLIPKNPPPIAPDEEELSLRKIGVSHRTRMDTMMNIDRIRKRITPYTRTDGSKYIPPYDKDEMTEFEHQISFYEGLKAEQTRQLEVYMRRVRLWDLWLKNVPGIDVALAAPLLAKIRFDRCTKPSAIHQFAGLGFHRDQDGVVHAQKGKAGELHDWCAEVRRALYIFFDSMNKCRNSPSIANSRYWKIYSDKYFGLLSAYGLKSTDEGATKEQRQLYAKAKNTARRVMCRVFLEDLYIVGRTLAGLPVWPDYNAAKMGYAHGGKIAVNEPKTLTIEEALALVTPTGGMRS